MLVSLVASIPGAFFIHTKMYFCPSFEFFFSQAWSWITFVLMSELLKAQTTAATDAYRLRRSS